MKDASVFILLLMAFKVIKGQESIGCEPMKSDMCLTKDNQYLYNMTGMPNLAGHKLQADANNELRTYFPLVSSKCDEDLQLFLCSVYVPVCAAHSPHQPIIGPCQPLCEKVRRNCEPSILQFGYEWPKVLDCNQYPKSNEHDHMCIEIPRHGNGVSLMGLPSNSLNTLTSNQLFMDKVKEHIDDLPDKLNHFKPYIDFIKHTSEPAKAYNRQCKEFKKSHQYSFISEKKGCIPKCNHDIVFNKDDKADAKSYAKIFASICFTASVLTVFIYLMNSYGGESMSAAEVAFAYRTPLFLALSYVGYSLGYLIHQIGLDKNQHWMCIQDTEDLYLAAQEGHRSQPCIIIFLFVHYFGLAASAWWAVVLFSWSLAQYCSAINKARMKTISTICHICGWGLPAIVTLVALLMQNFEADELTSMCYPGALQNNAGLLYFIIIPEGLLLILGLSFYLSGAVLTCVKTEKQLCKTDAKALNNFKWRHYCLGAIYLFVKIVAFETLIYEYINRDSWIFEAASTANRKPDVNQFWLRMGTSLMIGLFMPVWVLSSQTKHTIFYMWNRNKITEPSTFPTVPYRPQTFEMHVRL